MNKKVSYTCLAFCMSLYSVNGFAARRNIRSAGTTAPSQRTISTSLVSGYGNKYFKNPSITLVEKRSTELAPLVFTQNLKNITKTMKDGKPYEPRYKLCLSCADILLEYEVNGAVIGLSGNNNCYSLEPEETGASNYRLTVKSGAIEACGEKLRMTVNDVQSAARPEIDSVVLNLKPNSSAYDYSNIQMGQDTEIYDLIKNYNEAKTNAKDACNNGLKDLESLKGLLIGSTVTSGVATVTGGVDTTIQSIKTAKNENTGGSSNESTKAATITLSSVSGVGNLVTTALSITSGTRVDGIKKKLKACKEAAEKMHNAGIALEAGLAEIMSADE